MFFSRVEFRFKLFAIWVTFSKFEAILLDNQIKIVSCFIKSVSQYRYLNLLYISEYRLRLLT